jgi:pimeloyl-ACP methyl ester carboxylesterase
VADYLAALDHVAATRGLGGAVDSSRVVLWGTSYSGGHCLVAAAQRPGQVAAVLAMVGARALVLVLLGAWLAPLMRQPSPASHP